MTRNIKYMVLGTIVIITLIIIVTRIQGKVNQPLPLPTPVQNHEVTITGITVCLPHKDQSGPQTMECAFGLKDGNNYYALRDPDSKLFNSLITSNNKTITVTGTLKADSESKYDIVGAIEVTSVTED